MRISWRTARMPTFVVSAILQLVADILIRTTHCQYSTTSAAAVPCTFNRMCTCKMDDSRADIICMKVPFYKLPNLPDKRFTHIDIIESNLEAVENESFGSAKIESIRMMNNHIVQIEHRAFTHMENTLRSLDLSFNKLTQFPYKALGRATNLDWLNLNSNEIGRLHSNYDIYEGWQKLKETLLTLLLSDNDISDMAENIISQYHRLTWLNIDHNKIKSVSPHNLPATLRTLSICYNEMKEFPWNILQTLSQLSRLYLRGNYISQLPFHLFQNKKRLEKLDLGENQIEYIIRPTGTSIHPIIIRDLHLDFNRIRAISVICFKGVAVSRLFLSRNKIEKIDENAFTDLSNTLEYLDLEYNRLSHIPVALNALKRIKYLYMSSNRIHNISESSFKNFCFSLKAISLSGNQLLRIPVEALQECTKLSHLNLGYNYIREIEADDLKGWSENLDTLLLRNNKISEITARTFRKSAKLRELSLSFNKITNIHEDAFADLKSSLESLEVSFGLFQDEFFGHFLKPLSSLLWLALDNNNIHSISPNAFQSLQSVQYVNLDCNHISEIPNGLFRPETHKYLREIRLSNNHLLNIEAGTFTNLSEIANIVLCRNQITDIKTGAFENLPNLANILIARNRLSNIENEAFVNIPNLQKLDLQYNFLKVLNANFLRNISNSLQPLFLNLSNNQINSIEVNELDNVYIGSVDFSVNEILEVPSNLLKVIRSSLKSLDLSYNKLRKLNSEAFSNLYFLQSISLRSNNIFYVHKQSICNLASLQVLDLSRNNVEYLHVDVFNSTRNLRILDLSRNDIRSLPKNLFSTTSLESLDLSHNSLTIIPSLTTLIRDTVRKLDISYNKIDHLDSTMFNDVQSLLSLNLAHNRLTILPDNVFASIGNLLRLDISNNPLRANFKELFHYVQKLRYLNISSINLKDVPQLPLPSLISLRLSNNQIGKIDKASVEYLQELRYLYVDNNQLTDVPPNDACIHLQSLKELDLSNNPIKVLSSEHFSKLTRLQTLNIQHLHRLKIIHEDLFSQNEMLSTIKLDTYTTLENPTFHIGNMLSSVHSLRKVSVRVLIDKLTNQLNGVFHPKLKELEVTGHQLKYIRREAFANIDKTIDFVLRIRQTSVEELPMGLFEGIQNIAHLSLDLSDNRLMSLPSALLYHNVTNWENIGTKILQGCLCKKHRSRIEQIRSILENLALYQFDETRQSNCLPLLSTPAIIRMPKLLSFQQEEKMSAFNIFGSTTTSATTSTFSLSTTTAGTPTFGIGGGVSSFGQSGISFGTPITTTQSGFGLGTSASTPQGGFGFGSTVTTPQFGLNTSQPTSFAAPLSTASAAPGGLTFGVNPPVTTQSGITFGTPIQTQSGSPFGSLSKPVFGSAITPSSNAAGILFGAPVTTVQGSLSSGTPVSLPQSSLSFGATPTSTCNTQTGLSYSFQTSVPQVTVSFGTGFALGQNTSFGSTTNSQPAISLGNVPSTTQSGISFGTPISTINQQTLTTGLPKSIESTSFTQAGATSTIGSSTPLSLFGSSTTTTQAPLSFGLSTTPGALSFGTTSTQSVTPTVSSSTAATTQSNLFGSTPSSQAGTVGIKPTVTSLFGAPTSQSLLSGVSTSVSSGFSLQKPATAATQVTSSISTSTSFKGLGGLSVAAATSSQDNVQSAISSVKENALPNELQQTVKSFKEHINLQKNISSEVARISSNPVTKATEQIETLQNSLLSLSIAISRQRQAIHNLKDATFKAAKDFELSQKLYYYPPSLQEHNLAIRNYFVERILLFEERARKLEHDIEETYQHIVKLPETSSISAEDLKLIIQKLHGSFIAISGNHHKVHNEIQMFNVQHATLRNIYLKENQVNNNESISNISSDRKPRAVNSSCPFAGISDSAINLLLTPQTSKSEESPSNVFFNISSNSSTNNPNIVSFMLQPNVATQQPQATQLQLQRPPTGYKRGKR